MYIINMKTNIQLKKNHRQKPAYNETNERDNKYFIVS
jgi:hypothetical protein